MENINITEKYQHITISEEVFIDEDYPYYDVPDLPYCKNLSIYNSKIGRIGNLPICEKAEIITCLTGIERNTGEDYYIDFENTHSPLNLGNLEFIGDLPECKQLSVHAHALKRIGSLYSCEKLQIINESEEYYYLKSLGQLSVLIENNRNSIIYTGHHNMTVKDTVEQMVKENFPFDNIDFSKTTYPNMNDTSFIDLSLIDFRNLSFKNTCFSRCDLTQSDFRGCTFRNVVFQNCVLDFANLSGTNLYNTVFRNCSVFCTNLEQCTIPLDLLFLLSDSQEKKNFILSPGHYHPEYSRAANDLKGSCNRLSRHRPKFDLNVKIDPVYSDYDKDKYPLILKTVSKEDIRKTRVFIVSRPDDTERVENIFNGNCQLAFYFSENYINCPAFLYSRNHNIVQLEIPHHSLAEALNDRFLFHDELSNLYIFETDKIPASLAKSDFCNYKFRDTIFFKCNLSECDFSDADFENVSFIECDLTEANFEKCCLLTTSFKNCKMQSTFFDRALITPYLAGQLRQQQNFSKCTVPVENGCVSTLWFNRPHRNLALIDENTVWDSRNLYVVIRREMAVPEFIGTEKECYSASPFSTCDYQSYYVSPFESYLSQIVTYPSKNFEEKFKTIISLPEFPQNVHWLDRTLTGILKTWSNRYFYASETTQLCLTIIDIDKNALYFPNTFRMMRQLDLCNYLSHLPSLLPTPNQSNKKHL